MHGVSHSQADPTSGWQPAPASHFFCAYASLRYESPREFGQNEHTVDTSTSASGLLELPRAHARHALLLELRKTPATPEGIDYFALFEMPRKLWIEMGGLEQKFLQLSWKLHPDNFVNAPAEEQELSLKRSSEVNDAYRALRDPVARVEYLLELEGARKEGEHKQQAPPELLEEVFELNESLDELREAKERRRRSGSAEIAPRIRPKEVSGETWRS